jgi:hypothetical protein
LKVQVVKGIKIRVSKRGHNWEWDTRKDEDLFFERYAKDFPDEPIPGRAKGLIVRAIRRIDPRCKDIFIIDLFDGPDVGEYEVS